MRVTGTDPSALKQHAFTVAVSGVNRLKSEQCSLRYNMNAIKNIVTGVSILLVSTFIVPYLILDSKPSKGK